MVAMTLSAGYLPMLQATILYGLIPLVVLFVAGTLMRDLSPRNGHGSS